MVLGNTTIKSVLGQSQTLPCAGLNVAINGVSKYYKLGVSDRIGSKMVILGCDIGVKIIVIVTLNMKKFELSSLELNQQNSKLKKQISRKKNLIMEPHQPHFLCFLAIVKTNHPSSAIELTVETNHPSSAISCASTYKLPSSTSSSFISSESTTSSESSTALSPSQTSSASDNTALNGDITFSIVHESDTSGCDYVATPNTLSNCTAESMFDIPLAELNGITSSKLCVLQSEDNSLKSLRKLAKDSQEGCLYKNCVLMSSVTGHGVKRKLKFHS